MNLILTSVAVDIEVSPEQVAKLFTDMDTEQMAYFFNEVARITDTWTASFVIQMFRLSDDENLSDDGRKIMQTMGTYAGLDR